MIDYKKINKEISQQKWDRIHNKTVDEFTCYYCPGVGHELCTHPQHCILDKEFQRLRGEISAIYDYVGYLADIYDDALDLKEEFPEKDYDELYVNFSPKRNRITRAVLKKKINGHYKKLDELKTKKGGFK